MTDRIRFQLEPLVIVVAVAKNGVIGKDGRVPWRIPEDLRHFRRATEGHAIIMGRKTWDEIGKPLPKRHNLVVTRNRAWAAEGAEVFATVQDAVVAARATDPEPHVIGGAQIFAVALYFPPFDRSEWMETARRNCGEDPTVSFSLLRRRTP